jgi:hypothetical protein
MALTLSNGFLTELKTTTQTTNLQLGDLVGEINIGIVGGSGGGGNSGGAGWYFYSDEGYLNTDPPTANGNAIFLDNINGVETFDPNQQGGTNLLLHFNLNDSAGTSYSAQFSDATQQGSTITITQGSNVAEYFNGSGAGMSVVDLYGTDVFIINTSNCLQTQTAANPFNFNDPIILSFGG